LSEEAVLEALSARMAEVRAQVREMIEMLPAAPGEATDQEEDS
jgi:hypothetical protein